MSATTTRVLRIDAYGDAGALRLATQPLAEPGHGAMTATPEWRAIDAPK